MLRSGHLPLKKRGDSLVQTFVKIKFSINVQFQSGSLDFINQNQIHLDITTDGQDGNHTRGR